MKGSEFSTPYIIQAAQDILAAGHTVNDLVLQSKPGDGKPEPLAKVGEGELGDQAAAHVLSSSAHLPTEVTEELSGITQALSLSIDKLAVTLHGMAVKAADQRVDQIQRSADEQSGKQEAVLADASVLAEEQQARLTLADATVEDLTKQLAEAQSVVQEQNAELCVASDFLDLLLKGVDESGDGYKKAAIEPGTQSLL